MKKTLVASSILWLCTLLSACYTDKENPSQPTEIEATKNNGEMELSTSPVEQPKSDSDKQKEPTQQQVLSKVSEQLGSTVNIKLPNQLPLQKGKYLTATISQESNIREITFYSTAQPVPLNDKIINDNSSTVEKIAVLRVKNYSTEQVADEQIGFEDYASIGGEPVDLGHSITGFQDAGVGQLWTSWNEGRWALATHTYTDQPELGIELAKRSVEYLESYALPIPKEHGLIHLNATGDNQYALWADGKLVYELSDIISPDDLLEIAVSFQSAE